MKIDEKLQSPPQQKNISFSPQLENSNIDFTKKMKQKKQQEKSHKKCIKDQLRLTVESLPFL